MCSWLCCRLPPTSSCQPLPAARPTRSLRSGRTLISASRTCLQVCLLSVWLARCARTHNGTCTHRGRKGTLWLARLGFVPRSVFLWFACARTRHAGPHRSTPISVSRTRPSYIGFPLLRAHALTSTFTTSPNPLIHTHNTCAQTLGSLSRRPPSMCNSTSRSSQPCRMPCCRYCRCEQTGAPSKCLSACKRNEVRVFG